MTLPSLFKPADSQIFLKFTDKAVLEQIAQMCNETLDGTKKGANFDEKQGMLIIDLLS